MGALPLVFVTSRAEKAREAERMGFPVERLDLDLPEPQALDPISEIVEAKAAAYRALSRPSWSRTAASRSARGAASRARWSSGSRRAPACALARMLDGFPDRGATVVCAIADCDGAEVVTARGESEGSIALAPRGGNGFGWDVLFIPQGSERTFAEMSSAEKDSLSHRRRAWEALSQKMAHPLRNG
jgi:XTP/dITP diphosphohydrolase